MKLIYLIFVVLFFGCGTIEREQSKEISFDELKSTLLASQNKFSQPMQDFKFDLRENNKLFVIATDTSGIIHPDFTKYLFNYFFGVLNSKHEKFIANKEVTFIRQQTNYRKENYSYKFTPELIENSKRMFANNPDLFKNMVYFFNNFKDYDIGLSEGVLNGMRDSYEFYSFKGNIMELITWVIEDCETKVLNEYFGPLLELFSTKNSEKKTYDLLIKVWTHCERDTEDIYGITRRLYDKKDH